MSSDAGLASGRSRRSNAGNRLLRLLDEDDEGEEFYETCYGGFKEENDDKDYDEGQSDSDDVEDSDIDIDEHDEVISDDDEEGKKKHARRAPGVQTKAYKEPKKESKKASTEKPDKQTSRAVKKPAISEYKLPSHVFLERKKSKRHSTVVKTKQTELRQKELAKRDKEKRARASRYKKPVYRPLTQEELLAEAKETEKVNVASLDAYMRLEESRKKAKVVKERYRGPVVSYISTTMPLIAEMSREEREQYNKYIKEKDSALGSGGHQKTLRLSSHSNNYPRCSRNLIRFTDMTTFSSYFPVRKRRKYPMYKMCPLTKTRAKYVDPVTGTPFVNKQAFVTLRNAYYKQMSDQRRKSPELSAWLTWWEKHRLKYAIKPRENIFSTMENKLLTK